MLRYSDSNGRFAKRFWPPVNATAISEGQVIHLLNHAEDAVAALAAECPAPVDFTENLLSIAFDKSWRFVDKDPFRAHNPKALLRDRLWNHLELSMQNGEQDLLSLANSAIGKLQSELGTTSGR
jgi:hypothetical protein